MLKSLTLENFTVFPSVQLEFSPGLNAFVGENGTGKTHLLKMAYCLSRAWPDLMLKRTSLSKSRATVYFEDRLIGVFQPGSLSKLVRRGEFKSLLAAQIDAFIPTAKIKMPYEADPWPQFPFGNGVEELSWQLSILDNEQVNIASNANLDAAIIPDTAAVNSYILKSIFIPSKEIVSLYDGLTSLIENYRINLDSTYRDLALAIDSPELNHFPSWFDNVFSDLEFDLDGSLKLENNKLFFIQKNGATTEPPMMAEGHRKLALLMYLVRHGAIEEKGGSIYWDEPEANLNPRLMVKLAKILVALASHGIQVNIATHSLFFLKEIDLQLKLASATKLVPARFFALSDNGKGVNVSSGESLEEIEPIVALDMEIDQADRYNSWLNQMAEKSN